MKLALNLRQMQVYDNGQPKGAPMFLSFLLSRFSRTGRFVWSPSLDLSDRSVFSTLIPGAQY